MGRKRCLRPTLSLDRWQKSASHSVCESSWHAEIFSHEPPGLHFLRLAVHRWHDHYYLIGLHRADIDAAVTFADDAAVALDHRPQLATNIISLSFLHYNYCFNLCGKIVAGIRIIFMIMFLPFVFPSFLPTPCASFLLIMNHHII